MTQEVVDSHLHWVPDGAGAAQGRGDGGGPGGVRASRARRDAGTPGDAGDDFLDRSAIQSRIVEN